jgi:hypothetical protein
VGFLYDLWKKIKTQNKKSVLRNKNIKEVMNKLRELEKNIDKEDVCRSMEKDQEKD